MGKVWQMAGGFVLVNPARNIVLNNPYNLGQNIFSAQLE